MLSVGQIQFLNPSKVVYGDGCFLQFASDFIRSGKKRLFILTIPALYEKVKILIDELLKNSIETIVNMDIKEEPSFDEFLSLLNILHDFKADSVLGLGGGSVMDTAKLMAAMANNTQCIADVVGIGRLSGRSLYLACIPTTAGTGSEVSPNAIFMDGNNGGKKGVISPFLVPDAAYIDPELTYGVPAAVTAATGIDAFTHCLEAYINVNAHPMVDMYAYKGMQLIASALYTAVNDPTNKNARQAMALGSMYGGMCLGPVNTGAIHALSYPLGSSFKIPHGLSNAVLMPYVVEYNIPEAELRYAEVAHIIGVKPTGDNMKDAFAGVESMKNWLEKLKLPLNISSLGISESDLPKMASDAIQIQRLLKNNVREVDYNAALEIYKKAF